MLLLLKITTSLVIALFLPFAHASLKNRLPESLHVVMVTPRGETSMEKEFKKEMESRYPGKISFSLISPNVYNETEMESLASRVRALKPNLIYTWGTPTTLALAGTEEKPVISDIPIFFTVVAYPSRVGIVKNMIKSRKNLSGTSHIVPIRIQFDMMMKFLPFTSLGVLYNNLEPQSKYFIAELKERTKELGINLVTEVVDVDKNGDPDPSNIAEKVSSLKKRGAQWLYIGPDTFIGYTHRDITTKAAIANGIPSFTPNESAAKFSYGTLGVYSPMDEMGRFNAFKAIQLLEAVEPERISVDVLQRFNVLVNMCSVNSIKVYPPVDIKNLAEVITLEKGTCKMP